MKAKTDLKYLVVLITAILLVNSCKKEEPPSTAKQSCDTGNTLFRELYTGVVQTSPNKEDTTMDTETHAYAFEVSSAAKICKIGYQSLPTFNTTKYLIEIYNNTSQTLVYSGSHNFSAANTSYVSINPLALTAGNSYTIRRIQKNWGSNIGNTIGRMVRNPGSTLAFPLSKGILKITGAEFYGTTLDTIRNVGLPYIEIAFE